MQPDKDILRILTAGSVDDGKSTLIGRLLYDSDLVFEDHLEALRKASSRTGVDLDFSLLCDGLKSEREQGITIDVAYRYFTTSKRKFIIADCPGHEQYTRNMATGASTAELAIILIDARQGVLPQTKRHSFIATLLGIKHLAVVINKMDLVDYSKAIYDEIKTDYAEFAAKLDVSDVHFIPISALKGDNVVKTSSSMSWYSGSPLLDYLETVHVASDRNFLDFRMPVQYVARPDHTYRGYSGTVASGTLKPNDEVVILPAGHRAIVKTIETYDGQLEEAFPPLPISITIDKNLDISRGDLFVKPNNLPTIGDSIEAVVVWMDQQPVTTGCQYIIKHSSSMQPCTIHDVRYKIDISSTRKVAATTLQLNEIGRLAIQLSKPMAYDSYARNRSLGCFILIDRISNLTVGAGMIMARETADKKFKSTPLTGKLKSPGFCVWMTGLSGSGKTTLAVALEKELKNYGIKCERLDGDIVRDRLSKDLGFSKEDRITNIERVMFVAELLSKNGIGVISSFISPYGAARENGKRNINNFIEIYVKCPIRECERRDPKGLYAQARAGKLKQFTGIDDPYEEPENPDLVLETNKLSVSQCIDKIYELLVSRSLLLL